MSVDYVNAMFEGGGACLQLLNVRQLLRDKTVRGVHWAPLAFWTAWGFWNVVYYPSLGQWASFAGGLGVVLCNTVNLFLMWRYWPRRHVCLRSAQFYKVVRDCRAAAEKSEIARRAR